MLLKRIYYISLILITSFMLTFFACQSAFAKADVYVSVNGEKMDFDYEPVIVNDRTMIHLRAFADLFGCDISWNNESRSVSLKGDGLTAEFKIGVPEIYVATANTSTLAKLDIAPIIINDVTYIPLRALSEVFDIEVNWNNVSRTVEINHGDSKSTNVKYESSPSISKSENPSIEKSGEKGGNSLTAKSENPSVANDESFPGANTFYFQNEEKWQLPNYGSGYCWVMSYAMVLNNILGNVTPPDVASVNEKMCDNGAYCYHYQIAEEFGVRFARALSSDSPYFETFKDGYATYIKNPDKDDFVAISAIKEALDLNPEGVMIRFDTYPHTIVAVGYIGDTIYFNDPQPYMYGEYSDTNPYSRITFDKTYPYSKGLGISDLTFIQALDINN